MGCAGRNGVEVEKVEGVGGSAGWDGIVSGDDAFGEGFGVAGWDYGEDVVGLGYEVVVGGDEVYRGGLGARLGCLAVNNMMLRLLQFVI